MSSNWEPTEIIKPDARYEHWTAAIFDFVAVLVLAAILIYLGPDLLKFFHNIPDPTEETVTLSAIPWGALIFSRRTLGLLIYFGAMMFTFLTGKPNIYRTLRWSAVLLIVVDLLVLGKPQLATQPLVPGFIKMSMTLYRVIARQIYLWVVTLVIVFTLLMAIMKNLQIFLVGLQAGQFLLIEYAIGLAFQGRDELVFLATAGGLASLFHLDNLLPYVKGMETDRFLWQAIGFIGIMVTNLMAFYELTWPYLVKIQLA